MKTKTTIILIIVAFMAYVVAIILWSNEVAVSPSIPRCTNAPDVIVGNGEYNKQTGYWSEYNCVSDWRDAARISIKRGAR